MGGRQAKALASRGSITPQGACPQTARPRPSIGSIRTGPSSSTPEARGWFADRFEGVVLAGEGVGIDF